MTHAAGRDLPHTKRARKFGEDRPARDEARRIRKGDGTSFPSHGVVALAGIGGEVTRSRNNHAPRGKAGDDGRPHKEDGSSSGRRNDLRTEPRRPPFCMLFDDLDEDPARGVFGMYPKAFIGKILPWLQCERSKILHVCSGGLPKGEGIRVDIRPEAKPDFVADGRHMPFADGEHHAVLIDSPYTEHYAKELYGTSYPRPAHLLKEAARVVRPGGRIGFVHYIVPNPADGTFFVKCLGLSMGFGYPMRAVTFFERQQASLFGDEHPVTPRQARRRRTGGA